MIKRQILLAVVAILAMAAVGAVAEEEAELTVFTAASLTGAFSEIGQIYENETGINVAFNFDGSQALRTQIENGAYADVFASANQKQMNALRDAGLVNSSSLTVFARNRISLIVPKDNPAQIRNLSDLAWPGIKIVMGTKDVPMGDYSLQIIGKLANDSAFGPEYRDAVMANVISQETNIYYVVTKVVLGEADVGFAYASDVSQDLDDKLDKIEISDGFNVIAEYPMAMMSQSHYPVESQRFLDLVLSEEGRAVLEKYGFAPA